MKKKKKQNTGTDVEEGLPIWMQTFADMMTLLFAFFVLLYSMSSPDPVKYAAFQNSQAEKTGGTTDEEQEFEPLKDQAEIKQELEKLIEDIEIRAIDHFELMLKSFHRLIVKVNASTKKPEANSILELSSFLSKLIK